MALDAVHFEFHHDFVLVEEVLVDGSSSEEPDVAVVGDGAIC